MADAVRIRPASTDDARAIQQVARDSWHAAYDAILGVETVEGTVDSWFDPERVVADDVRPDDRWLYVAEADEQVVGFAETMPDDADETVFHLYRIYVRSDHWGEGVGSALLDRVEKTVTAQGGERLRLSVAAENDDAVAFYESKGFEKVGERYDDRHDVERYEYVKEV